MAKQLETKVNADQTAPAFCQARIEILPAKRKGYTGWRVVCDNCGHNMGKKSDPMLYPEGNYSELIHDASLDFIELRGVDKNGRHDTIYRYCGDNGCRVTMRDGVTCPNGLLFEPKTLSRGLPHPEKPPESKRKR